MRDQIVVGASIIGLIGIFSPSLARGADGTYDATVTTSSGSYSVPVDVEDGAVTGVHWPNGGDMSVDGADLDGTTASGINSRGDSIDIEVDDPAYQSDDDSSSEDDDSQ